MNAIPNFRKRDVQPFETDTKGRHSSALTVCIGWSSDRGCVDHTSWYKGRHFGVDGLY